MQRGANRANRADDAKKAQAICLQRDVVRRQRQDLRVTVHRNELGLQRVIELQNARHGAAAALAHLVHGDAHEEGNTRKAAYDDARHVCAVFAACGLRRKARVVLGALRATLAGADNDRGGVGTGAVATLRAFLGSLQLVQQAHPSCLDLFAASLPVLVVHQTL